MPGSCLRQLTGKIRSFLLIGETRDILFYSLEKLRKYRRLLLLSLFLSGISFPLNLAVIYIAKTTLDKGLLARDLKFFLWCTAIGGAVYALARAASYLGNRVTRKVKAEFSLDVSYDLTKRLFGLNYLEIKKMSSSENVFTMDYDCRVIEDVIFRDLPSLAFALKVPVFFALAALNSGVLALLVLVAFPFIFLRAVWASKKKKQYRMNEFLSSRKYSARFYDILSNIKLIKSFFKEDWALESIAALRRKKTAQELRSSLFSLKVFFLGDLISKISTLFFAAAGGVLIISGKLTLGAFTALSMYIALIIAEVYHITVVFEDLGTERPAIKRSARFIKEIPAENRQRAVPPVSQAAGFDKDIHFREVTFAYSPERMLLKDISISIPSGKWTLIKGPSGTGKTTLICLLLRLLSPSAGCIFFGGRDMGIDYKENLSGRISVAHQEPYLLNDTIRNNVLLGEERAGKSFEKAVFCAGVHGLVENMFLGYNTTVSESGSSLSGGQRQRVAIARALAREPELLILDEATSFLDPFAEEEIFGNIKKHYPGITVLYVTHRDSSQIYADKILVLKDGKLTDKYI
ncbi:MAG: ABC transporter ATP-binding protein [Candidatus Omnitrophota bacterium]